MKVNGTVVSYPVLCCCRELLANDPGYLVPEVFPELSTKRVLTTELIQGLPLDQCVSLPQEIRNDVSQIPFHSHLSPTYASFRVSVLLSYVYILAVSPFLPF